MATDFVELDESTVDSGNVDAENKDAKVVDPVTFKNVNQDETKLGLEQLKGIMESIAESSVKISGEIREMHKLYHNEFANRLLSMQEELERYHEIDKGRIFDGILTDLSKLYSENFSIADDVADEKIKKRLQYMFLDLLQILENCNVTMQKSKPGDKRNTRHCQVIERITTDNPDLHDTIASIRSIGFYIENRPLIKEMVDVYLCSERTDASKRADVEIKTSKEEN